MSNFEFKCWSKVNCTPMNPIGTKTAMINGQSVEVKIYPMGYAVAPDNSSFVQNYMGIATNGPRMAFGQGSENSHYKD